LWHFCFLKFNFVLNTWMFPVTHATVYIYLELLNSWGDTELTWIAPNGISEGYGRYDYYCPESKDSRDIIIRSFLSNEPYSCRSTVDDKVSSKNDIYVLRLSKIVRYETTEREREREKKGARTNAISTGFLFAQPDRIIAEHNTIIYL